MVISSKDTDRIWQALEAQPAKMIRLTTADQKTNITGWNPAKLNKKDFFESQIKPFLLSDATGGGMFVIQGRTDTHSKPVILLEIQKDGPQLKEAIKTESPETNRLQANAQLLAENADYKYKCKYLEEENDRLKIQVQELIKENDELIAQAEEEALLSEEEEPKQPELSPLQQTLLSAAAPLIPKLSDALVVLLDRFLPQNQPNQSNPHNQEQNIQYNIPFNQNHNGNQQ